MSATNLLRTRVVGVLAAALLAAAPAFADEPVYQDLNKSFEERAADLV